MESLSPEKTQLTDEAVTSDNTAHPSVSKDNESTEESAEVAAVVRQEENESAVEENSTNSATEEPQAPEPGTVEISPDEEPEQKADENQLAANIVTEDSTSSDSTPKETREPALAPRPDAALEPRQIELLIKDKSFKKVGKEKALQVSYDDIDLLKVLNMEPVPLDAVDYFPDWLNELDGKLIRIRGFMFPPFEATGIEKFLLARDNEICCFGRDPKIYDIIRVKMKEGTSTDYISNRPFDVIGRFHIAPEAWEGDEKLLKLYHIDEAVVISK
ncbi:MAG: hypothetical protein R3C11_07880 [Planctomycetaceae bacterium]